LVSAGRSDQLGAAQQGPNRRVELLRGFEVAQMANPGHYDKRRAGDRRVEFLGDGQGRAHVLVAKDQQRRNVDVGGTLRRSSADARAMARKPAGWNASMLAPNASTASGVIRKPVESPLPRRPRISHVAMEQHERCSSSGALISDAEPINLDDVHGRPPG